MIEFKPTVIPTVVMGLGGLGKSESKTLFSINAW